MTKIFVSGATGFIGSRLCLRLAGSGNTVHALYRSLDKTKIISHPNIKLFKGDIMDLRSLDKAIEGCEQVYHVAAFARVWERDKGSIYRLNIEGTMNIIRASIKAGARKIVVTSTAGVLGASGEEEVDEDTVPSSFFIDYETSKFILENILNLLSETGLNIVIVNPTRVYGPGLLSESNGVTRMIDRYLRGRWHSIPGNGKSYGNYVFVEDVVSGHILAMEKGVNGQRYILGGENITYEDLFMSLSDISGKKYRLYRVPVFIMLLLAGLLLCIARITGKEPLLIPALVRKFSKNFKVSSQKSIRDLGYRPLSLQEGLEKTVEWINQKEGQ